MRKITSWLNRKQYEREGFEIDTPVEFDLDDYLGPEQEWNCRPNTDPNRERVGGAPIAMGRGRNMGENMMAQMRLFGSGAIPKLVITEDGFFTEAQAKEKTMTYLRTLRQMHPNVQFGHNINHNREFTQITFFSQKLGPRPQRNK